LLDWGNFGFHLSFSYFWVAGGLRLFPRARQFSLAARKLTECNQIISVNQKPEN
jgi:hypothetical protein